MKAIFRLYLNTSKGNDSFLYRQLKLLKIRPKYDEHLHAFYLDAPLATLFHLSFHSFIAENMWVQIGKPFPAVSEQTFPQSLEKLQFKNYLPIKRGLVENMTLNIIIRETQFPLSDRVITSLLQNALEKEIVKKEYHQNIVKAAGGNSRDHALPFYELREIVERKWEQEDIIRQENHLKMIENHSPQALKSLPQHNNKSIVNFQARPPQMITMEEIISQQLASSLPYHPNLTFYVRKNQGRILLKLNKQEMYKHGWKKQVGWAPIRETIVAAILSHTKVLLQQGNIKIWDPFCGSATIPIVAAAKYYSLRIRGNADENFVWPHWNIFKQQYLEEYFRESQEVNKTKMGKLKLVCSDISFQAVNYTINNLKELQKSMPEADTTTAYQNVKRFKPTDQIYQLRQGEWSVLCGDFQDISKNVFFSDEKINIITNLPYTQSRSKDHIPLNQLGSIYRRFNKMIEKHRSKIANIFVIINNAPEEVTSPFHFLSVSSEKWEQVAAFQSGGLPIGLLAWSGNILKTDFFDTEVIKNEMILKRNEIESITDDDKIKGELVKFREKIQQIDNKNYYVPKHLLRFKRGWKRVVEKRRKRHLLRAYEIFSKRRDKMIAFAEYSNKKLEINMLRRGYIWRKRNMRILDGIKIEDLQGELKKEFESRISQALVKSEEKEKYRETRREEIKKQKQRIKLENRKKKEDQYWARKAGEQAAKGGKPIPRQNTKNKRKTAHKK